MSAALALALCNMCRVCMSVAVLPISQQFGWQPAVQARTRVSPRPLPCAALRTPLTPPSAAHPQGLVQASFLYGYTASQIQGGVLADRVGGKVVIAAAIAVFAVATLLTPLSLTSAVRDASRVRALAGKAACVSAALLVAKQSLRAQAVSAGVALPLMLAVRALVGLGEGACAARKRGMRARER